MRLLECLLGSGLFVLLDARSCAETYPIQAKWPMDKTTMIPHNCYYRTWNASAMSICLRGRRIITLGNSVARQMAFHLKEVLENPEEHLKRKYAGEQKDAKRNEVRLCSKKPKLGKGGSCQFHIIKIVPPYLINGILIMITL